MTDSAVATQDARARIRQGPARPGETSVDGIGSRRAAPHVAVGDDGLAAGEQAVLDGAFKLARRNRDRVVRIDVPDPDWEMPAGWRQSPSGAWTHPDRPGEEPPRAPVVLSFHVRPVTEKQADAIEERTTDYEANAMGVPIPVKQHGSEYNSELIIEATIEADRERVWRNRELLAEAGVLSSTDLVDALLPYGFKNLVVQRINMISGFGPGQRAAREAILGN